MKLDLLEINVKQKNRVVVDTSVLVSAIISAGAYRKLIRKLLGMDFELCIPKEVIEECEEVIAQAKFSKYNPLFTEIFDELKKSSIILPSGTSIKYIIESSPEDESIINCCVENGVSYLITADGRTLGKYNGLEVLHATDFYSRFLED